MPTRYIKESARTSKNLSAVSDFSERLFWRLVTTADDFGRFLACAAIVKSACFPLSETMKSSRVEHALQEIASNKLIGLYEVGDRRYGWFVNWERHQGEPRAKHSKYPDPPLSTSVGICLQVPAYVAGAPDTDTDTDTDLSSLDAPKSSSDLKSKIDTTEFDQFWLAYPNKVGKKAALKAWMNAKDRPTLDRVLMVLGQAIQSEKWRKEHGQFIPNPSTWLNQGRWDDQAVSASLTTRTPHDPIPRAYQLHRSDPRTDSTGIPEDVQALIGKVGKGMPT